MTVTNGSKSFNQWSNGISKMSQAQLANLLITNNQKLGYDALNSVQMYNALVQAGVSKETAKATVKQVLQTKATNAQTTATTAANKYERTRYDSAYQKNTTTPTSSLWLLTHIDYFSQISH